LRNLSKITIPANEEFDIRKLCFLQPDLGAESDWAAEIFGEFDLTYAECIIYDDKFYEPDEDDVEEGGDYEPQATFIKERVTDYDSLWYGELDYHIWWEPFDLDLSWDDEVKDDEEKDDEE